jgi:hypothetical protein
MDRRDMKNHRMQLFAASLLASLTFGRFAVAAFADERGACIEVVAMGVASLARSNRTSVNGTMGSGSKKR